MSDESDCYDITEEVDSKKHDKIVQEVLNLTKIQNVKKPSRTEPSLNISEFNLVKSVTGDKGSVQLNALTKVLKGRKKHESISKKVQLAHNKSKTLPAPLEKPLADRIRRTVNYEKTRLNLDRWEALVTANRVAPQLVFPLNSVEKLKIEEQKSETFPTTWRIKSELQMELEKLQPKVEVYHINKEEEESFPLTLKELKERRKEAAKLRAHQSFKEAKARQQNKIKSKKYHRILRKEKIKQKLKEFEQLQKTNPEEALKKLEGIEKARAEERFSLRHKNTGQWARNKQIRAKYDKESRQALSQQLALSRELTQKLKKVDSDSEEEIMIHPEVVSKENTDNPWVSNIKPSKEVADFVSGYKRYWTEKEKNCKENNEGQKEQESLEENILETSKKQVSILADNKKNVTKKLKNNQKTLKNLASNKKKQKKSIKKKKTECSRNESVGTSDWEISLLENGDVEDMFDKLEDKLDKRMKDKFKNLKNVKKNKKKKKPAKKKEKKIDLSLPSQTKKPIIDEEMIEKHGNIDEAENNIDENSNLDINNLKNILDSAVESEKSSDIDPKKFMQVKTTNLSTAIPDILTMDENEEHGSQRDVILEAFEDDDVAEEFKREKENEVKRDTPEDIDLNLPGWGSWAGTSIKHRKRRRRFILKMPAKMPRKDDNKGSLIINEKAQSKVKPLMVSEIPFPFKSVKDYEASIRAPISNTFVPETAFRKLIEPSVITKMGTIIEPITKSVLVGEKKV